MDVSRLLFIGCQGFCRFYVGGCHIVPFWDPKRDHNFDNYPCVSFDRGCMRVLHILRRERRGAAGFVQSRGV